MENFIEKMFTEELDTLRKFFLNEKIEEKSRVIQLTIAHRISYLEQQLIELRKVELQNKYR